MAVAVVSLNLDNTNTLELLLHIDRQMSRLDTRNYAVGANIQDGHFLRQVACLLTLDYVLRVGQDYRSQLKKLRTGPRLPDIDFEPPKSSGTSIECQRFSKEEYGLICVLYVYLYAKYTPKNNAGLSENQQKSTVDWR